MYVNDGCITYSLSMCRLFGYFREVRPFAWLIVELDFSDAVPTQCTYPDDYFEWIPSDGVSHALIHAASTNMHAV